jgi:hypothetical protein
LDDIGFSANGLPNLCQIGCQLDDCAAIVIGCVGTIGSRIAIRPSSQTRLKFKSDWVPRLNAPRPSTEQQRSVYKRHLRPGIRYYRTVNASSWFHMSLEVFYVLDQRVLIFITEIMSVVMALVFDEVRAGTYVKESL